MEIKPPVAIAIIVVVLIAIGLLIYKQTGSARYGTPPPITSGLPAGAGGPAANLNPGAVPKPGERLQGGQVALPGVGPGGPAVGGTGTVNLAAPPPAPR